jgi:hypothetical protein
MLLPIGTDPRPRRLLQLYAGPVLYGVSMALVVRSASSLGTLSNVVVVGLAVDGALA